MSLSRRNLIKLGGVTALATLLPDQIVKLMGVRDMQSALSRLLEWDLPAEANVLIGAAGSIIPTGNSFQVWNGLLCTCLLYTSDAADE